GKHKDTGSDKNRIHCRGMSHLPQHNNP
ncbi:MAG: hypothetical protein Q610_ECBC00404G0001, partial [Escherichia coli DORA_B_14]